MTQAVFFCCLPPRPPQCWTVVVVFASRLLIAAQSSFESLSLLLSFNKQLQLSSEGTPREKLRVPQSANGKTPLTFWNWPRTPTRRKSMVSLKTSEWEKRKQRTHSTEQIAIFNLSNGHETLFSIFAKVSQQFNCLDLREQKINGQKSWDVPELDRPDQGGPTCSEHFNDLMSLTHNLAEQIKARETYKLVQTWETSHVFFIGYLIQSCIIYTVWAAITETSVLTIGPGPKAAAADHPATSNPSDCCDVFMFLLQKALLKWSWAMASKMSHHTMEYPKSHQDFVNMSSVLPFSHDALCLSYCGIKRSDLTWGVWGCSSLHVLLLTSGHSCLARCHIKQNSVSICSEALELTSLFCL